MHEVMRLKIPLRITNCNSRERRTRGTEAVRKIMTKERPKFYFFLGAFEKICEVTIANSK